MKIKLSIIFAGVEYQSIVTIMLFLKKIIEELSLESQDLGKFTLVLPGKRPIVFIKKILLEKGYEGFLPEFVTIEELITQLSELQLYKGVGFWLFAYSQFLKSPAYNGDDFSAFLKWFPTLLKDWDDILKFGQSDQEVIQYLSDDERIRNWAENLADLSPESPRKKYLNFWKNVHQFIPQLKSALRKKNWGTEGMIYEEAVKKIPEFVEATNRKWVFCGFNALSPVEEKLFRSLLQKGKAQVFFHADAHYMQDPRQEAGSFLRNIKAWKEFNEYRPFQWEVNEFEQIKNIELIESPGNIAQTKYLSKFLSENPNDEEDTAIVLLDENLLPATLDAVSAANSVNITMGYPLKNLAFSNVIKNIFHLQKQLAKKANTYYFNDILPILEGVYLTEEDMKLISDFKAILEQKNIIYIRPKMLVENLEKLSFFSLLLPAETTLDLLQKLIYFCKKLKENPIDDILFENISIFEKTFGTLRNQLSLIDFPIQIEALEHLVTQMLNMESINFEGEPIRGLQIMGLLETRLLNFKKVIMLSVNEGKIPASVSQNSFIPFDIRRHFNLYTHQENDSIYAYHFYRLLQGAERVILLYNGVSSGMNTGEKSRFIMQLEYESQPLHTIEKKILDIPSLPIEKKPICIEKTPIVIEKLHAWMEKISASSLTNYIYDPIQFYLQKILSASESTEISEELTAQDYGTLVHYSLEFLYDGMKGKKLSVKDFMNAESQIPQALQNSINRLEHQNDYYENGINFIHRAMAEKVIKTIINFDKKLVEKGHQLEILVLEKEFKDIEFKIDENRTIKWVGFMDRVDILDGTLRIIDYKTAKVKNLQLNIKEENCTRFFFNDEKKQALQLAIYLYAMPFLYPEYKGNAKAGIWSFSEANKGVVCMPFDEILLEKAYDSIRALIKEILNPEIPFVENIRKYFP